MEKDLVAELVAELLYTAVVCASLEAASLGTLVLPVAVGCVGASACALLLVPLAGAQRGAARRLLATVSLAVLAWALLICVCRYTKCCERQHCAFFDEPVCNQGGKGDPLSLVPVALCGFRIATIFPVVADPIKLPVALTVAHGIVGAWTLLAVPFGWVYVSLLAWAFGGIAFYWLSARSSGGLRSFASNALLVGLHAAALAGAGLLYSRRALRVDALKRDSFAMPLLYGVIAATGLASVARMRSSFHSVFANDFFAVLAPIPAAGLPPLFSALSEESGRVFEQILKAGGAAAACFLFLHFDTRCGKPELLVYALATSAFEIAIACTGLLDRGLSKAAVGFQIALNIASAVLLALALVPFKRTAAPPVARAGTLLPRLSAPLL